MNKLLISIYVPSIEQTYDLFIPINKKLGTIKKYLIESIVELSGGLFKNQRYTFLDVDTGIEYKDDILVKDSGIKNGARIMII